MTLDELLKALQAVGFHNSAFDKEVLVWFAGEYHVLVPRVRFDPVHGAVLEIL